MVSIISGVNGQDGSYLAEYLLEKGEKVIGFSRRTGVHSTWRIDHLMRSHPSFTYVEGDITDVQFIWKLIADHKPDKFFNLAAQSHVHTSFTNPGSTFEIDTHGVLNILEAIRTLSPDTRFYQASTSELFGKSLGTLCTVDGNKAMYFQDESTPFVPQSPYAIAKLASHHLIRLYRESYGLKCCSGILFNHESPRRGDNFVTQKIIKWLVKLERFINRASHPLYGLERVDTLDVDDNIHFAHTLQSYSFPKLRLGNLGASRDWGYAKDYVKAMDLMLSQEKLDDYVVGTGETHTIREFLDEAFALIGIEYWNNYVMVDPQFVRPAEVPYLCANPTKIKSLGWVPEYDFKSLVKDMYEEELRRSPV